MHFNARFRVAKGTIFGLLYLLVEGGGAILLTKSLTLNFDSDIAGVFTVITYALALSNLMITSLGPAIARAVASSESDTEKLYFNLISGRNVAKYCVILLIVLYVLFAIIKFRTNINNIFFVAWGLYCLGHLFRLIGLYKCFELLGVGQIGVDRLYQLMFSFGYTAVALFAIWVGNGITIIALIYLCFGLIFVIVIRYWGRNFFNLKTKEKSQIGGDVGIFKITHVKLRTKVLAFEAGALLLNNVTGFFIMNGDVFVVQSLFGIKVVAEYSLYSRLAALIVAVGGLVSSMYFPLIANAWSKNKITECRRYRVDGIKFGILIFLVASIFAILIYRKVVVWAFSGVTQLPDWFIYLTLAYAAISIHTVVNGMPILATGKSNLVLLSLFNAICVIIFSVIGGLIFGLPGVPSGAILASILPTIIYKKKSNAIFFNQHA